MDQGVQRRLAMLAGDDDYPVSFKYSVMTSLICLSSSTTNMVCGICLSPREQLIIIISNKPSQVHEVYVKFFRVIFYCAMKAIWEASGLYGITNDHQQLGWMVPHKFLLPPESVVVRIKNISGSIQYLRNTMSFGTIY